MGGDGETIPGLRGSISKNINVYKNIIKSKSHTRKQVAASPMPIGASASFNPYPIEVEVGGATVFVLEVDRFEKV